MRIVYFGNNAVGLRVLEFLIGRREDVCALVVHPSETGRYRDEIIAASRLPANRVFDAPALTDSGTLEMLRSLSPEIGVSAFFAHILRRPVFGSFPRGCINIHPSLLPYNRGRHPNVWSIVDQTPAGATLHYIDDGVDTGAVVAQQSVRVTPYDTGRTLYQRLENACVELFENTWPGIAAGRADATPQDESVATSHRAAELLGIDRVDLNKSYTARYLIDVLRARTFPPYAGAYFDDDGHRVYVRVQLLRESELDQTGSR